MINKISELSTHFGIPYTTLRDWEKAENWRYEFLEKIDQYLYWEKKAVRKFLERFKDDELKKLLEVIFRNDIDNIVFMSIENLQKEIIADEILEEKEKVRLIDKIKDFCDFELYALIEFMYKYGIQNDNKGLDLENLKKAAK